MPKTNTPMQSDTKVGEHYYEFGGMKFTQKTKVHICNNLGLALCGVKSNWMEAGQKINPEGFVKGMEHLFPITDSRNYTCKTCLKRWLINQTNK